MQAISVIVVMVFAATIIHFIVKSLGNKAYKDGYDCGAADGDLMANPYLVGTGKRGDWMHGWRDGKSDFIMANSK